MTCTAVPGSGLEFLLFWIFVIVEFFHLFVFWFWLFSDIFLLLLLVFDTRSHYIYSPGRPETQYIA